MSLFSVFWLCCLITDLFFICSLLWAFLVYGKLAKDIESAEDLASQLLARNDELLKVKATESTENLQKCKDFCQLEGMDQCS